MIYYSITALLNEGTMKFEKSRPRIRGVISNDEIDRIRLNTSEFMRKQLNRAFFVNSVNEKKLYALIISENRITDKDASDFLNAIDISYSEFNVEETTCSAFIIGIKNAENIGFIDDSDGILKMFHIDSSMRRISDREFIINEYKGKDQYIKISDELISSSLKDEIERIYISERYEKFMGHPVHYIIEADCYETREKIADVLVGALFEVGRLPSSRYMMINADEMHTRSYKQIYNACTSSTILIDIYGDIDDDNEQSVSCEAGDVLKLAKLTEEYQREVLSIICVSKNSKKAKELFMSKADNCTFIEIKQDIAFGETAKSYLKSKAAERNVEADESLIEKVIEGKGYTSDDLDNVFFDWLGRNLKNVVFSQYANMSAAKEKIVKSAPKGSAYDELMSMIGLESAKNIISKIIKYNKAKKVLQEKGLSDTALSMHMVFTGAPGTAKTTVARLFAQIMKDNGVLSEGNLYEVGRADLVGKYVGWTAQIVKDKFREAKGGVLFIDEAYSLVDDRSGMYGDEAINTIVQEMENHRDNTIVIFAGYPDEMKKFLERNPGLNSRIAYHVEFDNYKPEELYKIAEFNANRMGVILDESCREKLISHFESVSDREDFGNGRLARTIIEKAKMNMAVRLIGDDINNIQTKDDLVILPEDIVFDTDNSEDVKKAKIGFVA